MSAALHSLNKIVQEKFPGGVRELRGVEIFDLLQLLLKREEYKGPQGLPGERGLQGEKGEKGDQGEKGEKGDQGDTPAHEWQGTKLRFQNADGTWGEWVELKGAQGDSPEFQWSGTKLRFKNPDGTWGEWVDLQGKEGKPGKKGLDGFDGKDGKKGEPGPRGEKGPPGKDGKEGKPGKVGPMPRHEIDGRRIRFETSPGVFGAWLDLSTTVLYQATVGGGGSSVVNNILEKFAGETISALKGVYSTAPDTVKLGQPVTYQEAELLGISITAGVLGEKVKVQTEGELVDASFNFPLNAPLYLDNNGTIVDTPINIGMHKRVGYSLGTGKIFIELQETIIL